MCISFHRRRNTEYFVDLAAVCSVLCAVGSWAGAGAKNSRGEDVVHQQDMAKPGLPLSSASPGRLSAGRAGSGQPGPLKHHPTQQAGAGIPVPNFSQRLFSQFYPNLG